MAVDNEGFIIIQKTNDASSQDISITSDTQSVQDPDEDLVITDVGDDIKMAGAENSGEWDTDEANTNTPIPILIDLLTRTSPRILKKQTQPCRQNLPRHWNLTE